jgi:repressor LexA
MTYDDEELDILYDTLSERQKAILDFIEKSINAQGFPPTIREIGEACDIASTSVVNYNLNKLREGGWLERTKEKSRGIRLLHWRRPQTSRAREVQLRVAELNVARIPKVGRIVASEPVPLPGADFGEFYDPDMDVIEISRDMLRGVDAGEVYALEVNGESMIDALIDDGDIVLLHKQQTCRDGDVVAVWLPERGETTLKQFYDEGTRIRLQPRNPSMGPIYIHPNNCQIQGKVLGVVRML